MAFAFLYPFYFLALLLLPIFTAAQSYSNVTLGLSLTASSDDSGSSPWISPSGEFAFGFRQIENQGFLLAIWFNDIPERTIVWSANRNNLVQKGSKVELTSDGRLILSDSTGQQTRIAEPSGAEVAYAAMLDTGNFVLASGDYAILWQSFDQPTDTILPTQTMNLGTRLVASISETNYSSGRFMFTLQLNGSLRLYTTDFPQDTANYAYWPAENSSGSGFQVIFNQSGYIYLIARNGITVNQVSSNPASTADFYQRAIIDYDGVFRQYIYPRKSASNSAKLPMAWSTLSFIPTNICVSIRGERGSGACGFNSYCSIGEDLRKMCQCPPGYSFVDPDDVMKGCKQNFVPQSCDEASKDMDHFELRDMPNTDWPLSEYERFGPVSEDWCRQDCLRDCFCAQAFFRKGTCLKKTMPFANGRFDSNIGGKTLMKVRRDNSISPSSGSKKKENSTIIFIVSGLLAGSVFLSILLLLKTIVFSNRSNPREQKTILQQKELPVVNLQSFTYKELEQVTGEFKEELGSGAFGSVYKGVLTTENQRFAAVKRLNKTLIEGEQEFNAEISAIGRTNHKNLVQLLGFCNEGQHRLLVYEYMSNGSLADFIFGSSKPSWYKRIQIAFGTARGLLYLHEECKNQIIHCDIKPQNILLDDYLTARISDFGLAKLLKVDQSHTRTAIRGTKGYVAPEWFKNLPVTVKVDVYSFGILLLELVCCRRSFEVDVKEESQMVLADWAYDCLKEGRLGLLVENDEEAMQDMNRVEKLVMIAIWCIQEDPSFRPTMNKVIQMMEGTIEVSSPPDQASFNS